MSMAACTDWTSSRSTCHSGFQARIALTAIQVAKPAFSQRSAHQFIVTRLPNHWCELVCDDERHSLSGGYRGPGRIDQQQRLAEEDRAGVLHRAGREIGNGHEIEPSERIVSREVVVQVPQGSRL